MRKQVALVVIVRSVFLAFVLYGLDQIDVLGTSPFSLSISAFLGVLVASIVAFTPLAHRGFFAGMAILTFIFYFLSWVITIIPATTAADIVAPFTMGLHGELALISFFIGALSTWGFWRLRDTPTIELILLITGGVVALSGHRDFRLDNPQELNTIAWNLGVDQVYLFSSIGLLLVVVGLIYLALASLPARRRLIQQWGSFSFSHGRRSLGKTAALIALCAGLFISSFHFVYQYYHRISLARLSNGVGEGSQEGLSPLGFHSALGSTNQPAALVRLEGDYRENPFTPMLYIRESALSQYNGHEMVIAGNRFDKDVSGNSPFEAFDAKEDETLLARTSLTHSIFLLADHKLAMAIDYPVSIRPLKNPNPGKFKATFRAISMAPGFTKKIFNHAAMGDPRWSAEERSHYLETTSDPRYQELARKITGGATTPIEQSTALTTYLSKNSIYTLTPNHQVTPDADQTAPYLFGDLRGYCVHFAHAMVYMLRSLGIPARIGTGYLTDLSQAKDGHILLRMSDRHAWAEVYLTGLGWTPFDIQPEQVESHADTQVDMKLLEDLMGLLEPGEEILPSELTKDEPSFESEWEWKLPLPSQTTLLILLACILAFIIFGKLYLRFGWVLASTPSARLNASYISLASKLTDLGYSRLRGETRAEYRARLRTMLEADALSLGDVVTQHAYAAPSAPLPDIERVDQLRRRDASSLKKLPRVRKLRALFNLSSVRSLFVRGQW